MNCTLEKNSPLNEPVREHQLPPVATSKGHEAALEKLKQDIKEQKKKSQLG